MSRLLRHMRADFNVLAYLAVAAFAAFVASGAGAIAAGASHITWLLIALMPIAIVSLFGVGYSTLSVDRARRRHNWRTFERDFWHYVARDHSHN